MTLPSHTFSPSNLGLPYAQEINRYMTRKGLLIREHDVEIGPETAERFEKYVLERPDRIHSAPYLITATGVRGNPLIWVHRSLQSTTAASLPRKMRQRIVNFLPGRPKPLRVVLSLAVPVQGGEFESEFFGTGYTWMPSRIWDLVFQKVASVDWTMLDTRISQACIEAGERAILHWDCIGSHAHVLGSEKQSRNRAC